MSKINTLVAQLREYADNPGYSHNDYADTMRQAAAEIDRHPFTCICDTCAPTKYDKFCRLRDEMTPPASPGGTYYPKYSEREAFELAIKETTCS